MKNKLISITLAIVFILSATLILGGCGNKDYPVQVANFTIDEEPENIVILDPSVADIVAFTGYDVKMVGRSDEVNQGYLNIVPSIGSKINPDVDKIKDSGAAIVFADSDLNSDTKEKLKEDNIQVITMSTAKTPKQLETNYITLGKILGGKVSGLNKGESAYNELIDDMDKVKTSVSSSKSSDVLYTVCYIYTVNNELKMMTSGTYGDMLLGYTGAVNAAVNIEDAAVDVDTLKIANPNFIFYSDDTTLENIKKQPVLSKLSAVRDNKMLMITMDEMSRQGQTSLDTLQKMVEFIYPDLAKTTFGQQSIIADQTTQQATQQTTQQATTAPASVAVSAENTSAADKYKINLDNLSLKPEDENKNVNAMQQRLYDLGYITDKENITGYYGEISQEAVKQFQKKNKIKETGNADNATLVAMFDNSAVKAK